MDFNEHKPIYLQIAERIGERILNGEWTADSRIPSVRESGIELGVNPNTVARAYDQLQSDGILYNKRGIGYFVSPDADARIREGQRKAFLENELPELFRKMELLRIPFEEISRRYRQL